MSVSRPRTLPSLDEVNQVLSSEVSGLTTQSSVDVFQLDEVRGIIKRRLREEHGGGVRFTKAGVRHKLMQRMRIPYRPKVDQEQRAVLDGQGIVGSIEHPFVQETPFGVVAMVTDRGIRRSNDTKTKFVNEDRVGMRIFPKNLNDPQGDVVVLAIADGVGGGDQGEAAAQILTEELLMQPHEPKMSVKSAQQRMQASGLDPQNGACATVTVLEEDTDGILYERTASAGDTRRIIIDGQTRKVAAETVDQSLVRALLNYGEISEEQYMTSAVKHILTNCIKVREGKIQEELPQKIKKGDILILLTDGVTDNFLSKEIAEMIEHEIAKEGMVPTAENICLFLAEQAFLRSKDAVTFDEGQDWKTGAPRQQPAKKDNIGVIVMIIGK